jgi:hypothetical protein
MTLGGSKAEWRLLHTDQDLEAFIAAGGEWEEPYPEPVLTEM